jgi:foldase protein PrsA
LSVCSDVIRWTAGLLAVSIGALSVAACGTSSPSLPKGAVATVGTATITTTTFRHWLAIVEKSQATQASPSEAVAPLDPPRFVACIAFHKRTDGKAAAGRGGATPAALRVDCADAYDAARSAAVSFLISNDWFADEASSLGIKVGNGAVTQTLATMKAHSFPTPARLHHFLAATGETSADLAYRARMVALTNAITAKVTGGKVTVTRSAISDYYASHRAAFDKPESRNLLLVRVARAAVARHIRALLGSGASFSSVAKRYSTDPASKGNGGALTGVTRTTGLAAAAEIFTASVGRLVGPVRTPFGYEIFRVQKINPPDKQTLAQATPTIAKTITAQRRQSVLAAFAQRFAARWRNLTMCAPGYLVADCKNAPPAAARPPADATTGATS